MTEPTIIAVDWSGAKKTNLRSGIWLAAMQDGRVVRSEAVARREDAVALVQSYAPPVIAGFDFSFGVPRWFAEQHRGPTIDAVWAVVERHGEEWLTRPLAPPFWSDACVVPFEQRFRLCEERLRTEGHEPKSIFALVGRGQVGAGSVRGMPHLATLRAEGFAIWPFDDAGDRTALEIYPSLLKKLAPEYIDATVNPHQNDAEVSARVMWDHRETVAALCAATDPRIRLEGDVWYPRA